ncbi:MAG: alanine--tRNA ligase, partial [Clostridiales bacterium]|nr:alanine--tRNA ligase [Clostridiales bacterium]
MKTGLNELREAYLSFFERKAHLRLASASLVPQNDKSLLLIAAGMAPLKPYFTGQEVPPSPRAVSCQKCVRTNDIENVGVTSRHCTFFEMLGNFSFGDYFKEEAIPWAWEFLTEVLEIPADILYPSVYLDDDEAFNIWRNVVGIAPERITRLGKEDNFWEHGQGPCGPCSEIYYDRGAEYGCGKPDCKPGCDCDRFVEIWNLVFTQFNKEEDGSYTPLANKNIDTGMGLERVAYTLQGADSVFGIDTFKVILDAVCAASGAVYGASRNTDISLRIITDHARAVTFMLSDGILPSNEGRGYVLRRLLRRAALHGKLLGTKGLFLNHVSKAVIRVSGIAYPELVEKAEYISKIIDVEETRFYETLDQGMEQLKKLAAAAKTGNIASESLGVQAFTMYDTFGFPLELTQEMLAREGIDIPVDKAAFDAEMEKQRTRARGARAESNFMGAEETALTRLPADMSTVFEGYTRNTVEAEIKAVIVDNAVANEAAEGSAVIIIPSVTVLYAESGGQRADTGFITTETGKAEITDCQKSGGNKSAHIGTVVSGTIKTGQKARVILNEEHRADTARNHTAAHLLHKALRNILGVHAEQAGSLVTHDRLRFDFTHFQPMTGEEIRAVEDIVNVYSRAGLPVCVTETTPQKAREMGAMA